MNRFTYLYTFSTPKDRGQLMPQTTAQTARNACPIGAALYRVNRDSMKSGEPRYLGFRKDAQSFVRVGCAS